MSKIENIKNLSFEQALKELENIVSNMEGSNASLDNAVENYEYAIALKKYLESKLSDAKLRISKFEA